MPRTDRQIPSDTIGMVAMLSVDCSLRGGNGISDSIPLLDVEGDSAISGSWSTIPPSSTE